MRSAHSRFIARVVVLGLLSAASAAPALAMAAGGAGGGGSSGGGSSGGAGSSGGHRAPTITRTDPCASGAFFRSLHDGFTARYDAPAGGQGCNGSGY
jgi:hypothetical protein